MKNPLKKKKVAEKVEKEKVEVVQPQSIEEHPEYDPDLPLHKQRHLI
jgi:hypothetical protein